MNARSDGDRLGYGSPSGPRLPGGRGPDGLRIADHRRARRPPRGASAAGSTPPGGRSLRCRDARRARRSRRDPGDRRRPAGPRSVGGHRHAGHACSRDTVGYPEARRDDRARARPPRQRQGRDPRLRWRRPLREPDPRAERSVAGQRARADRPGPPARRRRHGQSRDRGHRPWLGGREGVHLPRPDERLLGARRRRRRRRERRQQPRHGLRADRPARHAVGREAGRDADRRRRVERHAGVRTPSHEGRRAADRDHRRDAGPRRPPHHRVDGGARQDRARVGEGRAAPPPRGARGTGDERYGRRLPPLGGRARDVPDRRCRRRSLARSSVRERTSSSAPTRTCCRAPVE